MSTALDYLIHGPQDAPWLTLSHPIGADLSLWEGVIPILAQRYRVLAFSTRGHGRSGGTTDSCSMDDLAGDVLELWQALGVQRSHFLGLSLGGVIGATLALRSPQALRSLVVACARLDMDPAATDMWRQRAALVEREGMAPVTDPTLERWFTPEFLARQPAAVASVRHMLLRCPPQGFAASARALADVHLIQRLPGLMVPTLFLAGRQDKAVPAGQLEQYARLSPAGSYVAIDGPHILHLENPEGFSQAVLGFLHAP